MKTGFYARATLGAFAVWLLAIVFADVACSAEKFSPGKWKAHDLRHRMLVMDEVRTKHIRPGMSATEIQGLLGMPDEIDGRRWSYRAGFTDEANGGGHYGEIAIHFAFGSGGVKEIVFNR